MALIGSCVEPQGLWQPGTINIIFFCRLRQIKAHPEGRAGMSALPSMGRSLGPHTCLSRTSMQSELSDF